MLQLKGLVFGRLTAIEVCGSDKNKNIQWLCECECGNKHTVIARDLKMVKLYHVVVSTSKEVGNKFRKHGCRNTRLYSIWAGMKSRCRTNNKATAKYYKDRGISYTPDWEDFINFSIDMKNSYDAHVEKYGESNTSLDRIDGNKGYSLENCRWATNQIQSVNQRPHLKINTSQLMNVFLKELSLITGTKYEDITEYQFDYVSERMRNKYGKGRKGIKC